MNNKDKEYKKINARLMKWREMLQKGLHSDPQLLLRRVRKGIPSSLRIKVWPSLLKINKNISQKFINYSTVLIKESYDVYDINLDIPRTFSFQSQQVLRDSLFNVLKALSIQFPKIGYCQGMNFLTMRLLQVLQDDTTFYILVHLIKKNKSVYDNFSNPGFVNRQNQVFMSLLQENMPKVSKVLRQQNIEPVLYTPSWFLTLFSKSLQSQVFYRFFECFLVQGYCFVYKMALALIKLKEKQILENQMQQNLLFVPNMGYYDTIPNDKIIQVACSWSFNNEKVLSMQNKYSEKNKGDVKRIYTQVEESYEKKMLSPRRTLQWTIEDFKKTEVTLIEFDDQ